MPPRPQLPVKREGNPRIDFRVNEHEKQAIQKMALQRRQSTAEFVRSAVLKAVADQAVFDLSLEDRLNQAVADIGQIQQTLRRIAEPMKRLEALVAAAVASSALIRDDGTLHSDAGRQMVAQHIETALLASDFVLQTQVRQDALEERRQAQQG